MNIVSLVKILIFLNITKEVWYLYLNIALHLLRKQTALPKFSLIHLLVFPLSTSGGVSRIFERGGPISLGSLKKVIRFEKGGSNGLMGGGGPVH